MRNTRLEEGQAAIKIAGRNINNLRYADDTTLMAESEEVIDISPSNLDTSCASSSLALLMMYSAYKLNKQSDNI